jgi:hypothetical protein
MKHWFLFLIIPLFFINAGCQKPSGKKGPALRCIYDQSVFAACCREAVQEESKFQVFKRDPFYSFLYQGFSYEEGGEALREIEQKYPSLLTHMDKFRTSDLIGGPEVYDYVDFGAFSPTTLHHILRAGMIQEEMKQMTSASTIVQIGAGYGALCKILHDLGLWKTYAIVDLREHLELARKVLEHQGIHNVSFYAIDEIPSSLQCDMAISDLSFSEFSRPLQKRLIDQVLLHARSGLIWGHVFPKHFGVEPFTLHALEAYLKKHKLSSFKLHKTEDERANFYFLWNNFIKERT